jgi:hypothetical protein
MSLPRRRRERRLAGGTRTFFVRVPPVSEVRGVRTLKACEGSSHPSRVRVSFFSVTGGWAAGRPAGPHTNEEVENPSGSKPPNRRVSEN